MKEVSFDQMYPNPIPSNNQRLCQMIFELLAKKHIEIEAFTVYINYSDKIIRLNQNIGSLIPHNSSGYRLINDNSIINAFPTQVIAPGGNFFHCVNNQGIPYVIAGECALVPKDQVKQKILFDFESKVGSKSEEKYINVEEYNTQRFIQQRSLNKQILKQQFGDTSLVVVPNSFFYHLDLDLCVLPNGVVLLHSYTESLQLIEEKRKEISIFLKNTDPQMSFDSLREKILEHQKKSEKLFEITKKKLEKRNFIVMPVCGYLTKTNDCHGIIAVGFGGLPVVLNNGKILYTVPKNETWYKDYFHNKLTEAGVSIIKLIEGENLAYFSDMQGFFRCQTNTLPKEMISKMKKNK